MNFVYSILRSEKVSNDYEGFYMTRYSGRTGNRSVFLALLAGSEKTNEQVKMEKYSNIQFQMIEPHLGAKRNFEFLAEIQRKGTKITTEKAEKLWKVHYESSLKKCSHVFWGGRCADTIAGFYCDVSIALMFIVFQFAVFKNSIYSFRNSKSINMMIE